MISIQQLEKSFGKNRVLQGIDLEIKRGSITAILGPNGSGKTTLLKSLLGLVIPDKGRILVDGKEIDQAGKYRQLISYLPQIARFPENLQVVELLEMLSSIRRQTTNQQTLIDTFGLQPFMHKKLRYLSGGTRQKVNTVAAFMFDSPIIILDEPTTGLDPVALIKFKELVMDEKAKGKTILFTSHIMNVVEELTDDIVFLLEGKVYFHGSLEQLSTNQEEVKLERAIARILE